VAAAGETTAPSRMEQSVDVRGALLQLVQGSRLPSRLLRTRSSRDAEPCEPRSGVGVSVLLLQPSCFEGLRAILKIILPDDQASAKGHELKELLFDGDAASRSMPAHLDRDEQAVAQVEHFLGVEPDVVEGLEQLSPELMESVMAVVDGVRVGKSSFARAKRSLDQAASLSGPSNRRTTSWPRMLIRSW
jgi:hypothetical protein